MKSEIPFSMVTKLLEFAILIFTLIKLGKPSIALLGTGSLEQIKQLQQLDYRHYILCLDNDTAGLGASIKIIKKLKDTHLISIFILDKEKTDINDYCFVKSFSELLKYGKIYTLNEFYNRVDDNCGTFKV